MLLACELRFRLPSWRDSWHPGLTLLVPRSHWGSLLFSSWGRDHLSVCSLVPVFWTPGLATALFPKKVCALPPSKRGKPGWDCPASFGRSSAPPTTPGWSTVGTYTKYPPGGACAKARHWESWERSPTLTEAGRSWGRCGENHTSPVC